jgi:tetratricopeptide (TPR) repeat protein
MQNLQFGISTAENPSPWRAGADQNTTIEFSHDVTVQGKPLKAGKYGFHIIPQETGPWTLIFSTDNAHWGSYFYRPENDVLRVEATPQDAPYTEYLSYEFIDRKAASTIVALKWEEKMIPFTISVPESAKIHLAKIEAELNNQTGFNYMNLIAGANYALSVGQPERALPWADKAINEPFFGRKTFESLSTKANVLNALGRSEDAQKLMDEAIKLSDATVSAIHQYGRQLVTAGKKQEALTIFQYNAKVNKGQWPVNYGLARGYSAVGDFKNAIKYLELAIKEVPAGDTANPPLMQANLEKLKKGQDIN